MNTSQSLKGLKTFITTLLVSLFLFGAVYYVMSSTGSKPADIEKTLDDTTIGAVEPAKSNLASASVFEDLSKQKLDVPVKNVLAGATQSTQSTVPGTGSVEITVGLMLSLLALGSGFYVFAKNPRKVALRDFERDSTK